MLSGLIEFESFLQMCSQKLTVGKEIMKSDGASDGGSDGGDKKEKTFAEETLAIQENIWNGFFRWLGKKSHWFVSKLGYLVTKFFVARRIFLKFTHWQMVDSRGH